jgi:hypothetical protein
MRWKTRVPKSATHSTSFMTSPARQPDHHQNGARKMTEEMFAEQDGEAGPAPAPPAGTPGTALATRITDQEIEAFLAPVTLTPVDWIRVLMNVQDMPEYDPDEMALGMLAQILMADTPADVLGALDLDRAKDMCGGEPGGKSNILEIQGARALKSDYEEGAACYCIVTAFDTAAGNRIQFTTGAKAVQMVIAKMAYEGWLPFKGRLEIRREKTKRGFYPINLIAGI